MFRTRALLAFCAAAFGSAAIAATPQQPALKTNAAPVDQYFGAMKMSALGIRERIDLLGRWYHARTIDDADLVHDASLAEAALYAWQRSYPRDPWMVPTLYHIEQLYQAVQSADARSHALALLHFIVKTYPKTKEAQLCRLRLSQGFPSLHGESPVRPTPNPYVHASATPASLPSAAASPTATVPPAAQSPAPTATPT